MLVTVILFFALTTNYATVLFLQMVDIPGLNIGQADYYPYVYYSLNIDMVEVQAR